MTAAEMTTEKAKKKFKFPTAFTILVIPAGRYDYNDQGEPIPNTYHAAGPAMAWPRSRWPFIP